MNGCVIKTKESCMHCKYPCDIQGCKELCPITSSSILCDTMLLDMNDRLELVSRNGANNKYYHVKESNTVIFHVEYSFCVLIDYIFFASPEEKVYIPLQLAKNIYHMNHYSGRDWCRSGNNYLGYSIYKLIYGQEYIDMKRSQGLTFDHMAETYNEKLFNTEFNTNAVEHSHQVKVDIKEMMELNLLLDDIIMADINHNGVYYDKKVKKRKKNGRGFVFV